MKTTLERVLDRLDRLEAGVAWLKEHVELLESEPTGDLHPVTHGVELALLKVGVAVAQSDTRKKDAA